MEIVKCMMTQITDDPLDLSYDCRMNMWLKATHARNMISIHKDYVKQLAKVDVFHHFNFVQITLDLPRMDLLIDNHFREFCVRLLFNYTKRNPILVYFQPMAMIAQVIIKVISPLFDYKFNLADEYSFWLYTCILEDVLPVDYFCKLYEPLVLSEVYLTLFSLID